MNFDTAIDRVLGLEGGYTSGEGDPGGETNWGISKRSYPSLDIKHITRDQAKTIYQRDFWWQPVGVEFAVAYQVFDFAVNSGPGVATRYLQRAVHVADDGYWGPISMRALAAVHTYDALLRYLGLRLDYMTRLSNWPEAGKGWSRRISTNLAYAAEDV